MKFCLLRVYYKYLSCCNPFFVRSFLIKSLFYLLQALSPSIYVLSFAVLREIGTNLFSKFLDINSFCATFMVQMADLLGYPTHASYITEVFQYSCYTDMHNIYRLNKNKQLSLAKFKRKKGKGKGNHKPKAQTAGAYPSFLSMKHALHRILVHSRGQHQSPAVCHRYRPFKYLVEE